MDAGAWGLSTSVFDVDQDGRPVPSRAADGDEVDALLDVIERAGHGLVEYIPGLLGNDPRSELSDMARRCGARGIPLTWTGFVCADGAASTTQGWIDLTNQLASEGAATYPQLSPRTVDFRLNWDSSMMFMSMPEGWNKVITTPAENRPALLRDPEWRAVARAESDRTEKAMFPVRRLDKAIVEVFGAENERWLGRTLADLVGELGGHPSDVFADFVLANECRPGIVAVGVANADVDRMARTLADPAVDRASSFRCRCDMQMLCASGDTTLLLTRHVRERGDFTLESAVHELTGRQAQIFGFNRRGVLSEGCIADLAVFALDELHYDADQFVWDLPEGRAPPATPGGWVPGHHRGRRTRAARWRAHGGFAGPGHQRCRLREVTMVEDIRETPEDQYWDELRRKWGAAQLPLHRRLLQLDEHDRGRSDREAPPRHAEPGGRDHVCAARHHVSGGRRPQRPRGGAEPGHPLAAGARRRPWRDPDRRS